MPDFTVEEIGRGFQVNENADISRRFFVHGATSEALAGVEVLNFLVADIGNPPNIGSLVLKNIQGTEKTIDGWKCEARWATFQKKPPKAKGESEFNFEIATQAVKVVVPIGQQRVFKAPDAPDFQPHLIGDQGIQGQAPEGVEVFEPTHSEGETHYLDSEVAFSDQFKRAVKRLIGRTNNNAWKGHDPGEVLLTRVSGTRRGVDDAEVSFSWQVKENQRNLQIAQVSGIEKDGWQYLWPKFRLTEDGQTMSNQITHIVVATVFRDGDMTQLQIGQ